MSTVRVRQIFGSSGSGASPYVTQIYTPTYAGCVVIFEFVHSVASGTIGDATSVTGSSVTGMTKLATVGFNSNATPLDKAEQWIGLSTGTAGTISIVIPNTPTGCSWSLTEFDNVDTSVGTLGVLQTVTGFSDAATNAFSKDLAAFRDDRSLGFAVGGVGTATDLTATGTWSRPNGTNTTVASEGTVYGPDIHAQGRWNVAGAWGIVASELAGLTIDPGARPFRSPDPKHPASDRQRKLRAFFDLRRSTPTAGPQTFPQALTVTQTQTPTIVRSTGKIITAAQTQTASIVRSVLKTLTAGETQTPVLTASRAFLRTLTATQTQTATMVRSVGKILTAGETQTPTIVRSIAKTITAAQTQTPTIVRSVSKLLTATQVQTATLAASRAFLRTLTATQTQTATMTRSAGKFVTATQTQTASIRRTVGKIVTTAQTQAPTISRSIAKTLTATQVQVPTITKTIGKTLSATQTQLASLIASVITTTAKGLAGLIHPASRGGQISPGQQILGGRNLFFIRPSQKTGQVDPGQTTGETSPGEENGI